MAVEGIIGIKLGMTQIFAEDGNLVGCTVLQAGPCVVVQMRTKQKDGYEAAQIGLIEKVKGKNVTMPMKGHFAKHDLPPVKFMREVGLDDTAAETAAKALEEQQNALRNEVYRSNTIKVELTSRIAQNNDKQAALRRDRQSEQSDKRD